MSVRLVNVPVGSCSLDRFWRSTDCVEACGASAGLGERGIVGVRLSWSGRGITGSPLLWQISERRMLLRVLKDGDVKRSTPDSTATWRSLCSFREANWSSGRWKSCGMSKFIRLLIIRLGDREGRGSRDVSAGGEEGRRRDRQLSVPAGHEMHSLSLRVGCSKCL